VTKKKRKRTQHTRSITTNCKYYLSRLAKSVLFAVENHHDDNPVDAIVDHRVRVCLVAVFLSLGKKFKNQNRRVVPRTPRTIFSFSFLLFVRAGKKNNESKPNRFHFLYLGNVYERRTTNTHARPTSTNTEDGIDIAVAAAVVYLRWCLCVCVCVRVCQRARACECV